MANLSNLEQIHLSDNQFNGCVPDSLRNIPGNDLSELDLPYCGTGPPQVISERELLAALYEATDGPNWENDTNWLSEEPLESWYGVSTDTYGRVTGLSLDNNRLSGEIPPELGSLSKLTKLALGRNQLSGEIPPELGSLSNLGWLNLDVNQLTGRIPPELAKLSRLVALMLDHNGLTSSIPPELAKLPNLRHLWLFSNRLSGKIPWQLSGLSSLETLYLADNSFSECVPEGLRNVSENDLDSLGLPFC